MSHIAAGTRPRRSLRRMVVGLVVASAVATGAVGYCSTSWLGPSVSELVRGGERTAATRVEKATRADGVLPGGVSVFDDHYPGIANLDPGLRRALRNAAAGAAGPAPTGSSTPRQGIDLVVNSGWRSRTYQAQLLREAVAEYGSEAEAARWVATPDTSPHVSGQAVDLGPYAATAWLYDHGARYGLCPVYRNEPWHYELRPGAARHGCPPMYDDPTSDPRMRP